MEEFKKFDVVSSAIIASGQRKFTIADPGGNLGLIRYVTCRAGIAFATNTSPFYLAVVGRHYIDPEIYAITDPSYELIFEVIDHGLDLESRHGRMADVADTYLCRFYADLSGIHEESAATYRRFKSDAGFEHGSLLEAPHVSNIRMGVETIKSLVKASCLDIAKGSTAFDQLSRITEADLAEPDVTQKYYAVEALRHAVASFKRDSGSGSGSRITIKLPQYGQQQHGWMA